MACLVTTREISLGAESRLRVPLRAEAIFSNVFDMGESKSEEIKDGWVDTDCPSTGHRARLDTDGSFTCCCAEK
jgi:hypothetical protein